MNRCITIKAGKNHYRYIIYIYINRMVMGHITEYCNNYTWNTTLYDLFYIICIWFELLWQRKTDVETYTIFDNIVYDLMCIWSQEMESFLSGWMSTYVFNTRNIRFHLLFFMDALTSIIFDESAALDYLVFSTSTCNHIQVFAHENNTNM